MTSIQDVCSWPNADMPRAALLSHRARAVSLGPFVEPGVTTRRQAGIVELRLAMVPRITLVLLCAGAAVTAPVLVGAQDESFPVLRGRVLVVHDGDTIKVQLDSGPISIRFFGIDAPELSQSYGLESRRALAKLVDGREVDIEPTGQNSYERMVAVVYVGRTNVNEAMIKSGDAWVARKYVRKRQNAAWCAYENVARESRLGLWAQPATKWIDPDEWRDRKRRHYKYHDYSAETTSRCFQALGRR